MDSIFGIGLPELFFIAIIALIVLGPERLPGAIREVAKFLKQVRALGNELTSQFSEELAFLDEMNPRRIIEEATRPEKPNKKATKASTTTKTTTSKNGAASAAKPKTTTSKPVTATAAASTVAKAATDKLATDKSSDEAKDAATDEPNAAAANGAESPAAASSADVVPAAAADLSEVEHAEVAKPEISKPTVASSAQGSVGAESSNGDAETENRIAPPKLMHSIEHEAGKNGVKPSSSSTAGASAAPSLAADRPAAAEATSAEQGVHNEPADELASEGVDVNATTAEKQA